MNRTAHYAADNGEILVVTGGLGDKMNPPNVLVSAKICANVHKKKIHDLSPRANYTDRAMAACRRSDCQLLTDRGCHVVSLTDHYGRILGFLDRSRYFSIK
jgi:hypothetical protein